MTGHKNMKPGIRTECNGCSRQKIEMSHQGSKTVKNAVGCLSRVKLGELHFCLGKPKCYSRK
ncbi:MAG: hypothetical protein QG614_334 [Patescibacteria group bacterium]|nr:hypothetical protein [Patescibacteria group bacterium]